MTEMKPPTEDIRHHYDLSNEFYELILDPSMTYSCGIYADDSTTLDESQVAKLDLALDKAEVRSGMRLLDIGFGWGSLILRAAERFDLEIIGITLSQAQFDYTKERLKNHPGADKIDLRIQAWEQFHEPVDRIITLEVFEHFRRRRHPPFFERCREILADDGRMFMQTSMGYHWHTLQERGVEITHEIILFAKFMRRHIFPGGELTEPTIITQHARNAGLEQIEMQYISDQYTRTLASWAENLEKHRAEAEALTSAEVVDNYLKYFNTCRELLAAHVIDTAYFVFAPKV